MEYEMLHFIVMFSCKYQEASRLCEYTFFATIHIPARCGNDLREAEATALRLRMIRRKFFSNLPAIFTNLGRDLADAHQIVIEGETAQTKIHNRPDLYAF